MTFFAPPLGMPDRPENVEAEHAVVGSILANNRNLEHVEGTLRQEYFVDPACAIIYADSARRIGRGEVADAVTLRRSYESNGALGELKVSSYLADLLAVRAVMPSQLKSYAAAIRDCWNRRRVIDLTEEARARALLMADNDLGATIASDVAGELLGLAIEGSVGDEPDLATLTAEILQEAEAARLSGVPPGVMTGLADLDGLLLGLQPEELLILAGRPGMGKTEVAMNLALNVARAGVGAAFFSLEMSSKEILRRALANVAGVSASDIRRGHLDQRDQNSLVAARNALMELPFIVQSQPALTVDQIGLRVRRLARKARIGVVVVDYLQLLAVPAGTKSTSEYERIGANSRALKLLAKSLKLPIIALSQLNRGVEDRDDKRPILRDLRANGSIEQDADQVVFVFRAEKYLKDRAPGWDPDRSEASNARAQAAHTATLSAARGVGELIVEKNRHGNTGTAHVRFDDACFRVTDLSDGHAP